MVNHAAGPLGVEVWIYLVDREQVAVRALLRAGRPTPEPLSLDTPSRDAPTHGITDARDAGGAFLGLDRLVDMAERHSASGQPAAEVCRRLSHAVLDYQNGTLADDATLVLVDWLPGAGLP